MRNCLRFCLDCCSHAYIHGCWCWSAAGGSTESSAVPIILPCLKPQASLSLFTTTLSLTYSHFIPSHTTPFIHTFMHTYIQTYLHTYISHSNTQSSRSTFTSAFSICILCTSIVPCSAVIFTFGPPSSLQVRSQQPGPAPSKLREHPTSNIRTLECECSLQCRRYKKQTPPEHLNTTHLSRRHS